MCVQFLWVRLARAFNSFKVRMQQRSIRQLTLRGPTLRRIAVVGTSAMVTHAMSPGYAYAASKEHIQPKLVAVLDYLDKHPMNLTSLPMVRQPRVHPFLVAFQSLLHFEFDGLLEVTALLDSKTPVKNAPYRHM